MKLDKYREQLELAKHKLRACQKDVDEWEELVAERIKLDLKEKILAKQREHIEAKLENL